MVGDAVSHAFTLDTDLSRGHVRFIPGNLYYLESEKECGMEKRGRRRTVGVDSGGDESSPCISITGEG